ncbi:MAG: MupG family TIM beta-alpha barrel fold protein [Bacillota bacterium]
MRSVGVSAYAPSGDAIPTLEYLAEASRLGYTRVFTSLHITEQDPSEAVTLVREVTGAAARLALRVIADVSPRAFHAVGAAPTDLGPLARLGLAGIRVDFGYDREEIAAMTRDPSGLAIVLNASTLDRSDLTALAAAGMDFSRVEACHNFYPRPETGLSMAFLREKAALLREYAVTIWGFIPSRATRRGPLYQGLPTVEDHRDLPPARAAAELLAAGVIDILVIGDPRASRDELEEVASVWLGGSVPLRVRLAPDVTAAERAVVLGGRHQNRLDAAGWVVRSSSSREYAGQGVDIHPRPALVRPAYAVTVDNRLYLRYSGELQIARRDLPPDPRVNVLGRVVEEDWPLVDLIGAGTRFHFVEG